MKRFLYMLIVAAIINSCSSGKKETPAGGPCSYEDKTYPARLTKLDPSPDSSVYDAWFEVDRLNDASAGHRDTVRYSPYNSGITSKQVKEDSIVVGKVYKYVISTIKSGSCNPHIESIRLENY